jgi:hypothetical protein
MGGGAGKIHAGKMKRNFKNLHFNSKRKKRGIIFKKEEK